MIRKKNLKNDSKYPIIDAEFPEEDSSYVEEDDELSDESDITRNDKNIKIVSLPNFILFYYVFIDLSHNWLNFNQINEDSTAEYIWHGEKEVASYSACCGDALTSPHSALLEKLFRKFFTGNS